MSAARLQDALEATLAEMFASTGAHRRLLRAIALSYVDRLRVERALESREWMRAQMLHSERHIRRHGVGHLTEARA